MSISAVVSSASASSAISSAISMNSVTGLAIGGVLATVLLIILLSSQEITSASSYWNKNISGSFTMITLPLLVVFSAIVVSRVMEIL